MPLNHYRCAVYVVQISLHPEFSPTCRKIRVTQRTHIREILSSYVAPSVLFNFCNVDAIMGALNPWLIHLNCFPIFSRAVVHGVTSSTLKTLVYNESCDLLITLEITYVTPFNNNNLV